ncbi:MAG: hypothetical protein D6767_05185, partial [Candidatus Hydrogenedentota bacterium]
MLELFDGFIAAVATETHIPFKKEKDGHYFANVEFEGGRHQKVFVSLGEDEQGDPIIEYYSHVGSLPKKDADLLYRLLETNLKLTYGAIALKDDTIIIHQSYFLKTLDPERFLKSLVYVAAKADELE